MASVKSAQRYARAPEVASDGARAGFLNVLRMAALKCRAKRRTDLFEACALLQVSRTASREAHADALMRCLGQAMGKRITLFAPGTEEISFDEAWLVQLGRALTDGDEASTTFLLHSRIAAEHRRLIRYLVSQIAHRETAG